MTRRRQIPVAGSVIARVRAVTAPAGVPLLSVSARGGAGDEDRAARPTAAAPSGAPGSTGDEAVGRTTASSPAPMACPAVRRGPALLRFAASPATCGEARRPAPVAVRRIVKLRAATA
ncbi:hypothetical protein RND61_23995 [Streptomyces sp. TRM76323]|uniref:Uncharacterized protein n=1 Tax=Streptomyces tamarix TaxID=3078565 RepID=A0ABU3QQV7_9ACTN|nr:hypothetical protein [Streptomyces tamarix]MDT9685097.1 hypothetical protein [Streptomyces tamarix]